MTTGLLMKSLSRSCSCAASTIGVNPAANTSLRKGSETLPSLRTCTLADIFSCSQTCTLNPSPMPITYSPWVAGGSCHSSAHTNDAFDVLEAQALLRAGNRASAARSARVRVPQRLIGEEILMA